MFNDDFADDNFAASGNDYFILIPPRYVYRYDQVCKNVNIGVSFISEACGQKAGWDTDTG